MGKKLAAYTTVGGVTYAPGAELPKGVAEQITNPKAWGDTTPEPAPAGNASTEAWAEYAKDQGKDVEGLSRDEIRALFD